MKKQEVGNDEKSFEIPEIGNPGSIEPVDGSPNDIKKRVELEAFMSEMVKVRIAPTSDDGKNAVIVPQVNGVNQPIARGVWVSIKRRYLEVLARNKREKFRQLTPNPMEIERKIMQGYSAVEDPFEVMDPNPLGTPWLNRILAEQR